ncbi:MAG: DNA polymerase III subunit chi [Novosphingobium sp.]|nr:DNA polymerase III subunit chi [Novosphingobium sp.]MCP5402952.1 DNA polymerase III subunit chi [Novosphingobium sp.]
MRVDFYQLSRDPAEAALPLIARATLKAGERLLVVSDDEGQRGRISDSLWGKLPDSFLAHGPAADIYADRQPILLSDRPEPANGARYMAIADGRWRDADPPFERVFFMFDEQTLQPARDCWRMLGTREGLERRFWKQQDGKWVEGP